MINANLTTRSGSRGDCVILVEHGEWEEANCEDKNGFICTLEVPYGELNDLYNCLLTLEVVIVFTVFVISC